MNGDASKLLQLTCFAGLAPKLVNPVEQYLFIAAASGVVPDDTFTVTQAINNIGFGRFQIVLSFVVGLCWMADSMEMMILSILPLALHCEWGINQYRQAFLTTIVFIGMMISSTFWGKISDRFGRKQALIVSGIFLFFYGFLSTFSPSYPWILCLRYQTTQTLAKCYFSPQVYGWIQHRLCAPISHPLCRIPSHQAERQVCRLVGLLLGTGRLPRGHPGHAGDAHTRLAVAPRTVCSSLTLFCPQLLMAA